jgi:hypothetical protein
MDRIADLARDGKLQTTYRAMAGGSFNPIPKDWWNTELLDARFAFCVINPDRPFKKGGSAYIFVSRTDLETTIRQLSSNVQATINAETKCAKWLEAEFLADPDIQFTKTEFEERARKHFNLGKKPFIRAWDKATESHPERKKAGPKRASKSIR